MKQQDNKIEWREVELKDILLFEHKSGKKAGEGSNIGKHKFFTSSSEQSKFTDKFDFDGEHLIFSTGGQAGMHYCDEKFSSSNDCFVVKVINHYAKFIYFLLKSKMYLLEQGFKGAGLKHLSKDYLKKIKIKLPFSNNKPDLKEQERIVSILEKAEKLKERGKNANDLLDEYLKSVFNEMFLKEKDFPNKKLVEICEQITDGTHNTPKLESEGIPMLDSKDIDKIKINDKNATKFISKKTDMELTKKCKPQENDVLISSRGSIGKIAIVQKQQDFNIMGNIILVRPNKKELDYEFLAMYLDLFNEMLVGSSRGVAQKGLYLSTIRNLKIPLPPLPLQQKFAKIVGQVEKMKENVKKTKTGSEELFNSLMSKAFRGELI